MLLIVVEDIVGDRINEPGSRFSLRLWRSPSADKTKEAAGTVENKAPRSRYSVSTTRVRAQPGGFSLRLGKDFDIFRQSASSDAGTPKPPFQKKEPEPGPSTRSAGSSGTVEQKAGTEIEKKATWQPSRIRSRADKSFFSKRLLDACRRDIDKTVRTEVEANSGNEKFQFDFVAAFPKRPVGLALEGAVIFDPATADAKQTMPEILRNLCAVLTGTDFLLVTALICADVQALIESASTGRDDPLKTRNIAGTSTMSDVPLVDIYSTEKGFEVEWTFETSLANLKYTGDRQVAIDTGDGRRNAGRGLTFVFERNRTNDGSRGALRLVRIENLSTNIVTVDAMTGRPL